MRTVAIISRTAASTLCIAIVNLLESLKVLWLNIEKNYVYTQLIIFQGPIVGFTQRYYKKKLLSKMYSLKSLFSQRGLVYLILHNYINSLH